MSLAGCDSVFDLDQVRPDVMPIQVVDAEVPDTATCERQAMEVTVVEDTMLLSDNCGGANRSGTSTNINIGQGGTSRVLLRFELSAEMVQALADGSATDARLSLALRPNDCDCTNMATTFQVFAASNDWNEGTDASYFGADWCNRFGYGPAAQTAWQLHGADGASDRSHTVLATRIVTGAEVTPPSATIDVGFTLDETLRTDLRARMSATRLSLILVPTSGGTLFLYSRDGAVSMPASTLTLFQCR
jgi:hypothetical protein